MKRRKFLLFTICLAFFIPALLDVSHVIKGFKKQEGSIKIYDEKNTLIYEYTKSFKGYQSPLNLEEIPPYVTEALLAAEDERFYKHLGIDPIAIARALNSNLMAKKIVTGGSTITQQVAKGNLYEHKVLSNRYLKKFREAYSSLALEIFFDKKEILEKYLNNVYFGNNSYGIEAASFTYFNKPAQHLSLPEAALLVGMIKSPNFYDPVVDTSFSLKRRNEVLSLMMTKGYITEEEHEPYMNSPVDLNYLSRPSESMHFVEYALNEVLKRTDLDEYSKLAGYSIYTTQDTGMTKDALSKARARVEELKEEHNLSNAALLAIRISDGAIVSMIGSIDYFNEDIEGANNMTVALRQPGSALKPITYAEAFYQGKLGPEDLILDEKTVFTDKNSKPFVPYNYNGVFNGEVKAREALASSLNLPAVKVLSMVGVDKMINTAQRLGITTLGDPARYDLSVTLGGGEVTLLDLTNVYASFGRGGSFKETYSVKRIVNSKGDIVYEKKETEGVPVWGDRSEEISSAIFEILSNPNDKVLGFGRNNVLVLPFPIASKTGTTTDWHDNWTFGFTKDFSLGVWVGNADNSPMANIDGVTGAGPIWRDAAIELQSLFTKPVYVSEKVNAFDVQEDSSEKAEEVPANRILKITSPATGSVYIFNDKDLNFQRIAFEVSENNRMPEYFSVQYYIDGKFIGEYPSQDSKYLWVPEEGYHVLEAVFTGRHKETVAKDTSNFTVHKEKP